MSGFLEAREKKGLTGGALPCEDLGAEKEEKKEKEKGKGLRGRLR